MSAKAGNEKLYGSTERLVSQAQEILGFRDGFSHCECFVQEDGKLILSEIAHRIGGGPIIESLSILLQKNLIELALQVIMGNQIPRLDPILPPNASLGWVSLSPSRSGKITRLPRVADLMQEPGMLHVKQIRSVGDIVEISNPSVWCMIPIFLLPDPAQFESRALDLIGRFTVETE